MRRITLFIIHCSATRCGQPYSFEDCRRDHIDGRHFRDIGYHYYITRDGRVHPGRPLSLEGAHCFGHNRHSIGICYEGGLDGKGLPADTRTPRLEPPKGLSFVRRSERIQKRRTPWEALRPPRGASRLHGVVIVRVFPILLSSRSLFTDFQRGDVILGPRIADVLVDNATGIGCDRIIGDRP